MNMAQVGIAEHVYGPYIPYMGSSDYYILCSTCSNKYLYTA